MLLLDSECPETGGQVLKRSQYPLALYHSSKNTLGSGRSGSNWLHCTSTVCPWKSHLISLSLSFPICEMWVLLFVSQSFGED